MRKALSVAAMTIFVFGFTWQFGRWLLRWSGYGLGLRSQPGGYYDFVDSFADKIAQGASVGSNCRTMAVDEHRPDDPDNSSFVDDFKERPWRIECSPQLSSSATACARGSAQVVTACRRNGGSIEGGAGRQSGPPVRLR